MPDAFSNRGDSVDAPARSAFAITPSDSTDFVTLPKALFVGGFGNVAVILADDSVPVIFKNVQGGGFLPVRAKRVLATGTTATDLIGLA